MINARNAKLLGNQLTGKAAGVLDDDRSDAVALNAIQQGSEARPALAGVSPPIQPRIELADHFEAGTFAKP